VLVASENEFSKLSYIETFNYKFNTFAWMEKKKDKYELGKHKPWQPLLGPMQLSQTLPNEP